MWGDLPVCFSQTEDAGRRMDFRMVAIRIADSRRSENLTDNIHIEDRVLENILRNRAAETVRGRQSLLSDNDW